MNFKKWVKSIQTVGYKGAHMVLTIYEQDDFEDQVSLMHAKLCFDRQKLCLGWDNCWVSWVENWVLRS